MKDTEEIRFGPLDFQPARFDFRNVQHLIDPLDRANFQRRLDIIRYLLEIPNIFIGNQQRRDFKPDVSFAL